MMYRLPQPVHVSSVPDVAIFEVVLRDQRESYHLNKVAKFHFYWRRGL